MIFAYKLGHTGSLSLVDGSRAGAPHEMVTGQQVSRGKSFIRERSLCGHVHKHSRRGDFFISRRLLRFNDEVLINRPVPVPHSRLSGHLYRAMVMTKRN